MRRLTWPTWFLWLLLIIGCHRVSPIVGAWESPVTVKSVSGTSRIEFKEDGTYTGTVTFVAKNRIVVTDTGTWKLEDGNRLTSHTDDIRLGLFGSGPGLDRALKTFQTGKSRMIADSNAHPTDVLTWHGDDSFSYVNQSGQTRTYHRVK